jgi:hypothetical protein
MYFSDLMNLPYDPGSDKIDLVALERALPDTPADVREQWFSDHGRKGEFQAQFGEIDLTALGWACIELPAGEITRCAIYPGFRKFFDMVAGRAETMGVVHVPEVVAYWERHRTWNRPPVLLRLPGPDDAQSLRLVEGHGRVGALTGLIRAGVLPEAALHRVWLAEIQ